MRHHTGAPVAGPNETPVTSASKEHVDCLAVLELEPGTGNITRRPCLTVRVRKMTNDPFTPPPPTPPLGMGVGVC